MIRVAKNQSKNASSLHETAEERATRKANAAMEAEIKGVQKGEKHQNVQGKLSHGVFYSLVARHKLAIQQRDHERAVLRRSQGLEAQESPLEQSNNSSNSLLHSTEVTDALEVVDTEIQTISTLNNIARSIMLPAQLAGKPTIVRLDTVSSSDTIDITTAPITPANETEEEAIHRKLAKQTAEEKKDGEQLDKHIKKQLKRKELHLKMISVAKGTWTFMKTPVGILFTIYGVLVVFSGAGLVICLAGWVPGNKDNQVEAFSQSTNALFTIPGVGLIPWRLRDTYIMSRICHYRNKSNDKRKKLGLPPLQNANDLAFEAGLVPTPLLANTNDSSKIKSTPDVEKTSSDSQLLTVMPAISTSDIPMEPVSQEHEHMLSPKEAAALRDLQRRFAKNCTWYRPNETPTHYAYPIGRAVTITAFIDMNSVFQCLLCAYMWGYATHYHDRPSWSTGTFLPLSFVCGIVAGVVIWIGGKKTHKTKEVEERLDAAFEKKSGEA